jgi:hypothetical protein
MTIAGYETHPAADLFPMMEGAELQALADDIKAHGLHNRIVLFAENGKRLVLDGRNRLRACEMAGVAPSIEFWAGDGSPTEWVVSQNLHRRHLTTSQRAFVAAGLKKMFEGEARARMEAGTPPLNLEEGGEAVEKAAKLMSVSPAAVYQAQKVIREAPPEVVEAVRRGDVTVSKAATGLPPKPSPKPMKPKKEKDWNISLTLTLPHSALPTVQRALERLGFTGGGNHRRMKLRALRSAA